MKIKQTIRVFLAGLFLSLGVTGTLLYTEAQAAECGGTQTAIISCSEGDGSSGEVKDSGIWGLLRITLNIMLAGVGVLALAGIVWGAILYTSAGGNPEQVKKAMGMFTNVVIGVVAFAGMWVFLNFLIPGGAFTNL
jgi:hypothetical protein